MEIVVELLVEIVGQFVVELVFESGFRGAARALRSRVVRVVLSVVLAVGAGFGGGYWWGSRLSELGRTEPPSSLWVSIGLAVVFAALALGRWRTAGPAGAPRPPSGRDLRPWPGRHCAWPGSPC